MVFSFHVKGQETDVSLADKTLKEIRATAKNALRLGDTYTALFYYEEWSRRNPENIDVAFDVAELYRATRNYTTAEIWYQKIADGNAEQYPLSLFHLARVQMSQEKYVEAKDNLLKFKKLANGVKDPAYKKLLKNDLLSCDFAIGLKDSTATTVVEHLDTSINQPHIEFSPILIDENTMVYGSLKDNGVNYYKVELHDSMTIPLRKFYFAKKEAEKWVSKGEFEGPFNKEGIHVGNGALSEDGHRFYFTLCQKNWQNKMICQLYLSEKTNGNWQEPVVMNEEINMSNYTTTQPAIGRESKNNQEVIYFVSDRPGGRGGLDVWYTEYNSKKKIYKSPKNAGSRINTAGSEVTPYYDNSTHHLYFSSDGGVGIGGLDVFSIEGEKSKWEEPKNLKQAINSPADDIDFTLSNDHKGGFLVSNRKGGVALLNETCCDDIYEFKYTQYITINLLGQVLDSSDCLTDYNINLYINNKETNEKYLSKQIQSGNCDFDIRLEPGFDYIVEVKKDGYLNGNAEISTTNITKTDTLHTKINLTKIPEKPMVLVGILYEFDSPNLTPEAKIAIDTSLYVILKQNPDIIIQISSHTDSKGADNYNMTLSHKRAQSVVKYLVLNGINEKRLRYKGYGETMPIAINENPDGSDNPEGRALNRRTDFQIIGKLSVDDLEVEENEKDTKTKSKPPKKKGNTF
ncbi:MAG: OmpA family protein [Bacteroidetes bacterium]|nr:OmpA family protein [Bacteroidota bacterium]